MVKIQNRARKYPGAKEVKATCPLCGKEIATTGSGIIYVQTQRGDEHWIHRECYEINKGKGC